MPAPDQSKGSFPFQWHFTDRCNLGCSHCYRGDDKCDELPLSDLIHIADEIMTTATKMRVVPTIALTGGEPLMRPDDLFGLLDYLRKRYKEMQYNVHLMTNAVLVDGEIARKLSQYDELNQVQVSLDGGTADVHDAIRGPGSFTGAIEGVDNLLKYTNMSVSLSYTFHRQNVGDLPQFLSLSEDIGVHGLHITRLAHIGSGTELGKPMMADQVRDTLVMLYEWQQDSERMQQKGEHKPSIFLARSLFHLVDPQEAVARHEGKSSGQRLGNACAIGVKTSTILSDGTFVLCRRLPLPVGNLLETPFMQLWSQSELLWQFRTKARKLKGKCQRCKFAREYGSLCSGGASCVTYSITGEFDRPDPQCWYQPEESNG